MLIRYALKSDLDRCEELLKIPEMQLATGDYMTKEYLEVYLDKDFFLVAENDHKNIIGVLFAEPLKGKGAMLWMIAIDNTLRNSGVGSLLLSTFENRMKSIAIEWIILYGYLNNNDVINFYKKHNYSEGVNTKEFVKIL